MSQLAANSADWRTTFHTDSLSALSSLRSMDDFSGRAALYLSAGDTTPLQVDLFVQNVNFAIGEHIQISPYLGDIFGAVAFGKAPMSATISAILADSQKTYGKQYLVDAYKNRLRLSAVARTGVVPVLRCENSVFRGPLLAMRITEESSSEDTAIVILTMIVMSYTVIRGMSSVVFDYVHGIEKVESSEEAFEEQQASADTDVKFFPVNDMPMFA